MKSSSYNAMLTRIVSAMNDGSLILFVGAGISINSGLPSWGELIDIFSNELELENKSGIDNLKIAQYYYNEFGKNSYMEKLDRIFNKEYQTNELHDLIKNISPKHIITTNYDTLLEKTFQNFNQYTVISSDVDIVYNNSDKYLIKMHGDFKYKNIVLKEDDYLDYSDNFPMTSNLIQSLVMNNTVLFIGYSLGDDTFNSIFRIVNKSFGDDAKKAIFFSAEKISNVEVKYYGNKGINVVYNCDTDNLGENTRKFLKDINDKNINNFSNEDDIWKEISYFDNLNFVEFRDIYRNTNLSNKFKFSNNEVTYRKEFYKIQLKKKEELFNFLKNKTQVDKFLGETIKFNNELVYKSIFKEIFEKYKKHDFSFTQRELINDLEHIISETLEKKDYITYLIAKFNLNSVKNNNFKSDFDLEIEKIISNSKYEDKKLIIYLRDNVFNMLFLHKKYEIISELYNKIREEHHLYKNGGASWNNNLPKIRQELRSLELFIERNNLFVKHSSIYKKTITIYFEALLLCVKSSSIPIEDYSNLALFENNRSSVLGEIDREDFELIFENVNIKSLRKILEHYDLKKNKVNRRCKKNIYIEKLKKHPKKKKATVENKKY